MLCIPAIDLLGGRCVRLRQGRYDDVTIYDDNPLSRALSFVRAGAKRIHIVDLDAARGEPSEKNRRVAAEIAREAGCEIELGGGIRTRRDVELLLEAGVDYLILGTVLVKNPSEVEEWVSEYGNFFIAGIDARDGLVKISGWEEGSSLSDIELAKKAKTMGLCGVVHTNIARDGMLTGPDIERSIVVAEASGLPVTVSGGVSCMQDVRRAWDSRHRGLGGIILGKAVYDGRIDLTEVFSEFPQE
ncbi:1-(5-phosphoribosyl)-5-[(5-phosphoribosylamino)methylideneamino]imidazole-4-carboxamide isomerase [Spirochaetia bacterium 38H-sp]|uniref:1-(5-phosphoribosyl)-5-[(5-phosphoribosylamino)methylideneamino] imidazole-4-carboxamide isomerase n=1 Tax=Rarispira pelagica TaxID=3141764 RepID=A0ABU9U9H4_9SPIR